MGLREDIAERTRGLSGEFVAEVDPERERIWFRRARDIPGFDYELPVEVDCATLRHRDASLERRRGPASPFEPTLEWRDGREQLRRAPARDVPGIPDWQPLGPTAEAGDPRSQQTLKWLATALELPGEPRDYYDAFVSSISSLARWQVARAEPDIIITIERLAWTAVALVEACASALRAPDGQTHLPDSSPFTELERIYAAEGFLQEASAVAHTHWTLGFGVGGRGPHEARLANLRAEDDSHAGTP